MTNAEQRPSDRWWKIAILAGSIVITVSIHYGLILPLLFGHSVWVHAVHSRLCYIPIVMAAAWFGLRGGVLAAAAISLLIQPYILFSTSPHLDVASEWVEVIFYFAIGTLIGSLVDRETWIRRRQEETARQLERSHQLSLVGQMAAGVAHEIKNPLASIKGAVEIVNSPATSADERAEFQKIISSEINRIDGTVKEFLEFARPKEFVTRRADLGTIVGTVVRQMESQISQRQLKMVTDIERDIEADVDAERIHQVALNLLLNAVEASDAGALISVRLKKDSDGFARLSVSDQGRGIKAEEIDRVFDPFYTTKAAGTGLGLAIVRSIVERHGGRIRVESEPNRGTTFVVSLPVAEAP